MAGEKITNNNADANVNQWDNLATKPGDKTPETTKNFNKQEIGKKALRAAILGLIATAVLSPAFSRNNRDKSASANSATKIESVSEDSGSESILETAEEEAPSNPWEGNNPAPMRLTPERPEPPRPGERRSNPNPEGQQDWAESPLRNSDVGIGGLADQTIDDDAEAGRKFTEHMNPDL